MIGNILKYVRHYKGYTQEELGKLLSLADTTVSSYERGNSQPDFDTVVKILDICGFEINVIEKISGKAIEIEQIPRKI